ncbi:MAG: stage III sporulation protein AA [Desulfotomaculaceae bacterium]|nr:stage III sporulation protein AA [Desulfotomaculaceae bacterium]
MNVLNSYQPDQGQGKAGAINDVLPVLPANIRSMLAALPDLFQEKVEEIRLRQGRPLLLGLSNGDVFLCAEGRPTHRINEAYQVTPLDMERVIQLISNSSLYALEEELRNGFITLPGGHRAGITGKAVLDGGKVRTLKYLSGCNIRISREISGAASVVLPYLLDGNEGIFHTVIVSPPCCGKTTMLRDLIRQVSNGVPELGFPGMTVGVVDERSEIAGCYKGIPQRDVGLRTDVLDGCPKAEGMMMLLRAMNPRVIAADEIGRHEDVKALEEVLNAGVKVIITAHGKSLSELLERPVLGKIIKSKMLERFVILGRSRGVGTLEEVIDGKLMRAIGVRKC